LPSPVATGSGIGRETGGGEWVDGRAATCGVAVSECCAGAGRGAVAWVSAAALDVDACDSSLPAAGPGAPVAASAGVVELLELSAPAAEAPAEGAPPSVIAGGPFVAGGCDDPLGTGAFVSVELVAERARASSARLMV